MAQDTFNYTDIGAQDAAQAAKEALDDAIPGGGGDPDDIVKAVDFIVEAALLETLARIRDRLNIE